MQIANQQRIKQEFLPANYELHEGLKNAVEVALALDQPLLLTGEPGTGKTKLALKVANDLNGANFNPKPFVFNTKTTSTARDLFYTYDAVAHFQAANIKRAEGTHAPKTVDFIELQALGKAIANTNPSDLADQHQLKAQLNSNLPNSVVLIDEIDKAPRDFTNDILNEIESYAFTIKEINKTVEKQKDQQVLVIMTSNSEKNFPDAFLRRCVFYHIPFPDAAMLKKIALTQLGSKITGIEPVLGELIDKFEEIRAKAPRKKPATAEFIAWLQILNLKGYLKEGANKSEILLENLSVLVKTKEDLQAIKEFLKNA